MKRTITVLLLLAVLFLSACGSEPVEAPQSANPPQAATDTAQTANSAPAPAPAPETPAPAPAPVPADPPVLTGSWKQTQVDEANGYQYAVITDDKIEVYWSLPDVGNMLYWAGSFEAPATADEPYSWASANDTGRTSSALLASGDAEKAFTYSDGKLTYDVTISGETVTVCLESFDGELPTAANPGTPAPQEMEGTLGRYGVRITGHRLAKDYENKDVLILQYDFTNNGTETACAGWDIYIKAFQDGIQIDTAFLMDDDYLGDNANKEIKPGVTISCEAAFTLANLLSPVEIEVTELISFSDEMIIATLTIAQ